MVRKDLQVGSFMKDRSPRVFGVLVLLYGLAMILVSIAINRLLEILRPGGGSEYFYSAAALLFSLLCCAAWLLIVAPGTQWRLFFTLAFAFAIFPVSYLFALFLPYLFPAVVHEDWYVVGAPLFVGCGVLVGAVASTWALLFSTIRRRFPTPVSTDPNRRMQ